MNLETITTTDELNHREIKRLLVAQLLAKKPDYSFVPVYKSTGVYYGEESIYEVK